MTIHVLRKYFFGLAGAALLVASCATPADNPQQAAQNNPIRQAVEQPTEAIETNVAVLVGETNWVTRIERNHGTTVMEKYYRGNSFLGWVEFNRTTWFRDIDRRRALERNNFDAFLADTPFRNAIDGIEVQRIDGGRTFGHTAEAGDCLAVYVAKRIKAGTNYDNDIGGIDTIIRVFTCQTDLPAREFVAAIGLATPQDQAEMVERIRSQIGIESAQIRLP